MNDRDTIRIEEQQEMQQSLEREKSIQTEILTNAADSHTEKGQAAELIANVCKEEYMRLINTYDNMYNKVNILLVVCMAVFIAQADSFKWNVMVHSIMQSNDEWRVVCLIIELIVSVIALALNLAATVLLCFLLKSKKVPVVNCFDLRNQRVYEGTADLASVYLIGIYTDIMKNLNQIIEAKQKKYDLSVIMVVISVILFVIEKMM